MSSFGFVIVLFLSWALPVYGVIYNQLYPSYESALGVAYGFLLGCIVHFLMLLLWLAIRRSRLRKPELITLLTSLCVMIVLTALSSEGALSKMAV